MEIACFLIGISFLYTLNSYLLLSLIAVWFIIPRYSLIIYFLSGIALAFMHYYQVSPRGFPQQAVMPYATIQGQIVSIPVKNNEKTQFIFLMTELNQQKVNGLVQLAWYTHPAAVQLGQHWQFVVKLKKPRNFNNPGSYDYVQSLRSRHIEWTGYIRSQDNKLLAKPSTFSWLALREQLSKKIDSLSPNTRIAGIIEALTLNITTHIRQDDWNLFRRTGTTHLFGISGEHIALISGIVIVLLRKIWSLSSRCCLYTPALSFASLGGFVIAALYALLAGFAPPVQRALIGCFCFTWYCLGKQQLSAWQVWRYALLGVLCIEPHAAFMQGFYFSFLAVACLLLTQQRWGLSGYKARMALQLSCLIGLMPLTLYWFSYGSLNGFIANLFAIPLVGLFIVPLALITILASSWSGVWVLMKPLTWLITLLFDGLFWTEKLSSINLSWALSSLEWVISWLGALALLTLLPVKPFKHLAILWLIIPFFPSRSVLNPGEVSIQVLDVGQGLAVNIQTQHHVLLYDTGDQFFHGSDLGKMVVLPFYNVTSVKKVDTIIISHPDKDHRGGLQSIEDALPVGQLLVNDRHYYDHGLNCHQYPAWSWDGVSFRFLPIKEQFNDRNNNSCILKVSNEAGSMLLAGDIEKAGEDYLVRQYGAELASTYLVVPHHGSKTSSSLRFLLEVNPHFAISSLGFDNRFRFPHKKTLDTMQRLGIEFYRTDQCGMIEIKLSNNKPAPKPHCSKKID